MWARVIGRRKRVIAPTRVKNKYERNYGAWYGGRGDVWGEGDRGAISSRRLRAVIEINGVRIKRNQSRGARPRTRFLCRPRGRDWSGKKATGKSIVVISV